MCQCTDPGYPASVLFDRTDSPARAQADSISRSARETGRPSAAPTASLTHPTEMSAYGWNEAETSVRYQLIIPSVSSSA